MNVRVFFAMIIAFALVYACVAQAQQVFADDSGARHAAIAGENAAAVTEPASDETPPAAAIPDAPVPLSSFGGWALLNLVLTIVTGLIAVAIFIGWLFGGRRTLYGSFTFVATAAALALFAMTENMSHAMFMTDKWTVWHIVITATAIALAVLGKVTYEDDEERFDAYNA